MNRLVSQKIRLIPSLRAASEHICRGARRAKYPFPNLSAPVSDQRMPYPLRLLRIWKNTNRSKRDKPPECLPGLEKFWRLPVSGLSDLLAAIGGGGPCVSPIACSNDPDLAARSRRSAAGTETKHPGGAFLR